MPFGGLSESSESGNSDSFSAASPEINIYENVITNVIARRSRGELISDEEVIKAHPELMPGLQDELAALADIDRQCGELGLDNPPSYRQGKYDLPECEGNANSDVTQKGITWIRGYKIERPISSGGQARVFRAFQEKTGRVVAIKVIFGGPFVGSRSEKRFERETTILAKLNHSNIVGILDRGRTSDGCFFLTMDFIEGSDLEYFIKRTRRSAEEIVKLFIKIGNVLDYTHEHGVVHRDLKPKNILVDEQGEPRILDFGMASLFDSDEEENALGETSLTQTGQILGTLPWASPEQVSQASKCADHRSDIYALGVMLYVALTNVFPYEIHGDAVGVVNRIRSTPPSPLRPAAAKNGVTVDRGLEQIVLRALCKSADDRYQSAASLVRDLDLWLSGNLPVRRRFLVPIGLAVGLLLLAALLLLPAERATKSAPISSFVNPIQMRFVRIPAGEIQVNSADVVSTQPGSIVPGLLSVDRDFYLSATLVTRREYLEVMGMSQLPRQQGPELDYPVQDVSLTKATAFCDKLGEHTGHRYRLPTPIEWKYALLTGKIVPVTKPELGGMAWYADNSGGRPHEVDLKQPNRWGLYDMLGNLRQWCVDSNSMSFVEGTDYTSTAEDCLRQPPSETQLSHHASLPTVGFRIVCESSDQN